VAAAADAQEPHEVRRLAAARGVSREPEARERPEQLVPGLLCRGGPPVACREPRPGRGGQRKAKGCRARVRVCRVRPAV
jgi:hypothetical protein